jgi:hypothetical protein
MGLYERLHGVRPTQNEVTLVLSEKTAVRLHDILVEVSGEGWRDFTQFSLEQADMDRCVASEVEDYLARLLTAPANDVIISDWGDPVCTN